MKLKGNDVGRYLIYLVVFTTFFRGFIRNFFGIGTILVDICFFMCIAWSCFCLKKNQRLFINGPQVLYIVWAVICIIFYLLQCLAGRTGVYGGFLGFRNIIIYSSLFVCVTIILKKEDIEPIYHFIERLGVCLCGFAIIQYLGRNVLPEKLLNASDAETYWYVEANAIRVNGLVENTIVFGAFTVIMIAIMWAELIALHYRSINLWIGLVICISSCFLTFGRACFVGCWTVIIIEWFIDYGTETGWKKIVRILKFLLVTTVILVVILTVFKDSIIVERMLNQSSEMNIATNRGHIRAILDAVEVISDHLIIGYGIDKAGFSISDMKYYVIGDGTFWALLLQWGLIPVLIFYLLIFITMVDSFIFCKNKTLSSKKVQRYILR